MGADPDPGRGRGGLPWWLWIRFPSWNSGFRGFEKRARGKVCPIVQGTRFEAGRCAVLNQKSTWKPASKLIACGEFTGNTRFADLGNPDGLWRTGATRPSGTNATSRAVRLSSKPASFHWKTGESLMWVAARGNAWRRLRIGEPGRSISMELI